MMLVVDGAGHILDRSPVAADARASPFKGRTVLVVPGLDIVTRWIKADDEADAATLLLKEQLAVPVDGIHIALGQRDDVGLRVVSAIDRDVLQHFLDRAAELGLSPDVVVPDHLMLPAHGNGLLVATLGSLVAVHGEHTAFTAENELASMLTAGRERVYVEDVSQVEQLLAGALSRMPMNLLQQDFTAGSRGRKRWTGYGRVAALAAAVALSPLAIWAAQIVQSDAAASALEARAQADARTIIGRAGSGDPIRELRGRMAELRANDSLLQRTAALFESLSRTQGAGLEALSYVEDGVIRATIVHASSSGTDALRQALEQQGLVIEEDAADERDGRTVSTITLRSAP
jgi:general secretion pathway protein L